MARTTTRRHMSGAVVAAVALLVLSACGGTDGDSVASAGGQENPRTPRRTRTASRWTRTSRRSGFAGCMRDNGVEMPDPGPGQQGMNEAWQAVAGDYERATLEQAIAACQDLIPQYPGQEEHGSDDWQLAVAECLREQGLDVSDDVFDDIHSGEIDQDELAAMEECRNAI